MHRHRRLPGGRDGLSGEARPALRPVPRAQLTGTPLTLDLDVLLAANPSPLTGKGTNTYVLGRDEVAVVDPGPALPEHLDRVEAAARARGRTTVVLLTHHHPDHSEAAVEMARRLDAPLAAIPHPLAPRLDRALAGGDQLDIGADTLEVLATPGHCRDHACFEWKQAMAIFVGDLVAGEGFIVIDPPEGDMADYLNSLRLIRDRGIGTQRQGAGPAQVLLPGHGPSIDHPTAYIETYISHRLGREAKVLAALTEAASATPQALLPIAYADTPEAMYPIAARSLQAHLDKLVKDGRVVEVGGLYSGVNPAGATAG
ncbi:MAG: MBL fold metallo-hydrolase [Candidatus Dormibacteria bacterium]